MTAPALTLVTATPYTDWLVRVLGDAAEQEHDALYRARLASVVTFPLVVTRHQCPHCRRTWAKQNAAAAHVARCWLNPAVRTCKTCRHFQPYEPGGCWGDPQCNCPDTPESCAAGIWLENGIAIDCPLWQLASDEGEG